MKNLEERLKNAETALFTLATIIIDTYPPEMQDCINYLLSEYYDANISLGMEPATSFTSSEE